MIILLVATLCKSGKAERVFIYAHSCLKKKNMNIHEYTRIRKNKIHEKFMGHL